MSAFLFALQVMELAVTLAEAGQALTEHVRWSYDAMKKMKEENRDPTQEEWDILNARIEEKRKELHSDEGSGEGNI